MLLLKNLTDSVELPKITLITVDKIIPTSQNKDFIFTFLTQFDSEGTNVTLNFVHFSVFIQLSGRGKLSLSAP